MQICIQELFFCFSDFQGQGNFSGLETLAYCFEGLPQIQ